MKIKKTISILVIAAIISMMTLISVSAEGSYIGSFVVEGGSAAITTYATQDYTTGTANQTQATATDSDTGEADVSGSGQINFTVIPSDGYEVYEVTANGNYKNIKGPADTGLADTYRITKITGNLTITVTLALSSDDDEGSGESVITFSDNSITQTGSTTGTSIDGTALTISAAGTYTLTGSCADGNIVVAKNSGNVTLILSALTLTSTKTAPLASKSGTVLTITAEDGTASVLTDTYRSGESPKSCINIGGDLILNGSGSLTVNGNNKNGIKADGNISVSDLTLKINSLDNSLAADNVLTVNSGNITAVSTEGDCLKSEPDEVTETTQGIIVIGGGTFNLTAAANDGIQAITSLKISGGDFTVKTGGGSTVKISEDEDVSYKGIKSDGGVTITGGKFNINSADDSVHSNGDIYISGGEFTINTGDDGIHADGKITIDGGTFNITAVEGIEATSITVNDGNITISASDDGINAAQKTTAYSVEIIVNGGTITVTMGQGDTDGFDSNGSITINAGTVTVTGQSAFDYDTTGTINGGTVTVNGKVVTVMTNQFGGGTQPGQGGGLWPGQGGGNQPGDQDKTDTDETDQEWYETAIAYLVALINQIIAFVESLFA